MADDNDAHALVVLILAEGASKHRLHTKHAPEGPRHFSCRNLLGFAVSPSPDNVASPGWLLARSVNTVFSRRHSIHSAGVGWCFDETSVLPMFSQIITRRSASG